MKETLTYKSVPDKELGGYMGVVSCKIGNKTIKDSTGIT